MRLALAALFGAGAVLALAHWRKPTAWLLTRVPPATHPDSRPRFRVWQQGVEVIADGFPPLHM